MYASNKFSFKRYDFSDLALKLHLKFVEPIINIVRDKAKEYALPDYIYFKVFYEDFSEDQRLKIKKLIRNFLRLCPHLCIKFLIILSIITCLIIRVIVK